MKFIQNSAIYAVVMVLKNGIGFLLLPIYTMYLTTQDYGIVSIVTSLVQFLSIFVLLSLNAAGMRYHYEYKSEPEKQKTLWGTVYNAVLLNAFVIVTVVILAHEYILDPFIDDIPFYPYLFVGVLACFFQSGYEVYQTYLKSDQAGKRSGLLDLGYFVMNIVLALVLVAVFKLKAMGVIWALMATNLTFGLISHFQFRSKIQRTIERQQLKQAVKYSLPLLPHALAGWTMTLIDRIFLNNMMNTAEVGIYAVGFQIANVLHMLMVALNQAYGPWFFEQSTEGDIGKQRVQDFSELFVLCFSVLGLVVVFFTPEILTVMVTEEYRGAWVVVPFLAYAFVCRSVYYMVIGPVFLNRVALVPIVTFTGAVLNIVLNAVLIGDFGKTGAAAASGITMLVTSLMAVYMSKKVLDFGYRWKRMYVYVLTGFGLSLIVFLPTTVAGIPLLAIKVLVTLIVAVVVYVGYKGRIAQFVEAMKTGA